MWYSENLKILIMLQQMGDEFYPMLTPQEKQVTVNVPDGLTLWGDADKLARDILVKAIPKRQSLPSCFLC